jgi:hypothetical protein
LVFLVPTNARLAVKETPTNPLLSGVTLCPRMRPVGERRQVAFAYGVWLCCLGIHQRRCRVDNSSAESLKFANDSAGIKGGLLKGSAFFVAGDSYWTFQLLQPEFSMHSGGWGSPPSAEPTAYKLTH